MNIYLLLIPPDFRFMRQIEKRGGIQFGVMLKIFSFDKVKHSEIKRKFRENEINNNSMTNVSGYFFNINVLHAQMYAYLTLM